MEYKRYPNYQDTGSKWLSSVPDHWRYVRLGQYFTERNEKVSDKDYSPLSVTMGGIVPQLETAAKTDAGDNRKKVCQGDFVINSRSDRKGSSGLSTLEGSVSLISIVLKPDGIDGAYVHHLLRSQWFQEEFYRFGKGIVDDLWSTKYTDMKSINIPVPSVDEQQAIATFLDRETARIDALIEKKQRLIELLKEKRQAIITQAVTKGFDTTVLMKDSGLEWLGEVPEHWGIKQVRHLVSFVGGGTPSKENLDYWQGDIPWVSPKDMKTDFISSAQDNISLQAVAESSTKLIGKGAVLIVVRGMILLHSVPVAMSEVELTINQDMKALIPSKVISSKYLLYLLKGFRDVILSSMDSSAHGTRVLPTDALSRLQVALPTLEEQANIILFIESQLARFDRLMKQTEKSIQLLQEHRSSLITAAVTGQIDVRESGKESSDAA